MNNDPIKNIRYVVISTLNRMRLDVQEYYDWLEQIAIEWLTEEVAGDLIPSVETAKFNTFTGARVWAMPADYIAHCRVGYVYNESFYTLTRRDDLMVDVNDTLCGVNEESLAYQQSLQFTNSMNFPLYYYTSVLATPIYTISGGKNIAYYKIEGSKRRIVFSLTANQVPSGEITIEYLSSGKGVNGNSLLNPVVGAVLRKYLEWQLCEHDNKLYPLAKDKERQYYEDKFNKEVLIKPITSSEIIDTLNSVPAFNLGR
jgi:hypothetical protein